MSAEEETPMKHAVLGGLPGLFQQKYPDSSRALKTLAWI